MQIEESFRDTKNPRYGLGLRYTGTRSTSSLQALMLIAHIATLALHMIGLAAEAKKMHLSLQSNSIKNDESCHLCIWAAYCCNAANIGALSYQNQPLQIS